MSKLPPAPVPRQMRRNSPLSCRAFFYRGRGDFRGIGGRGDCHLHQHTREPVSGYTEDVGLYKDADCFESLELADASASVTIGKADVTREENLIAAIEALREINDDSTLF